MKVTYNGEEPEVQVARGGVSWTVVPGEPVDLPDDVALGLDGQDAWTVELPKTTTGRKATTPKDEQP